MSKKNSSKERVRAFAANAGFEIDIIDMPSSTRTAEEAAKACDCEVSQIVKSLIFQGAESGNLYLLLVSGANKVNLPSVADILGEPLQRADPKDVRKRTGFSIGGVAPFASLETLPVSIDQKLLDFKNVWAAGGAPNSVFRISVETLVNLTGAKTIRVSSD